MARTKDAEGRAYRDADHQACIKIAQLRLSEPTLSIWQAVFRVIGNGGGYRHQGKDQRRVHSKYERKETYYVELARSKALQQQPPIPRVVEPQRSITSNDISAIARAIERTWQPIIKAQQDYERLVRPILKMQEDWDRFNRTIMSSLPKLPKIL
jgi:hypothetical protein